FQNGLGIVGDFSEVRGTFDVETAETLTGRSADEADPTLSDHLRIEAVGVAFHERHAGHADDVGFAAGERQDALSTAADHDRWVWPLHWPWPPRVPAHLNEVARIVQLFALPVRLDEGDDLGQLGDSPTRTVEVQAHRGVLDFAPTGADPHFQ